MKQKKQKNKSKFPMAIWQCYINPLPIATKIILKETKINLQLKDNFIIFTESNISA